MDAQQDEGPLDQRHAAGAALGLGVGCAAAPAVEKDLERHEAEARGALGPLGDEVRVETAWDTWVFNVFHVFSMPFMGFSLIFVAFDAFLVGFRGVRPLT